MGDKMNIRWLKKETNNSAITIHNNNITLSKKASDLFADAYGILVGIDEESNLLILKKVTNEQIENKEVKKEQVYFLTQKPTYGRINSKHLINLLDENFGFDFKTHTSYKFDAKWHTGENMLLVAMNGGIK